MPGELKHIIESDSMRVEKWSLSSIYKRLSYSIRATVYSNHLHFLEEEDYYDSDDDSACCSAGRYSLPELRSLAAGNYNTVDEKRALDLRQILFSAETNFVFRARAFKLINKTECKLKPILDPAAGQQMISRLKLFLQLIDTLHIPAIFGFELRQTHLGLWLLTDNENWIDAKTLGIAKKKYSSLRDAGRKLLAIRNFQIGFIVGSSGKDSTPLSRVSRSRMHELNMLGIITSFLL